MNKQKLWLVPSGAFFVSAGIIFANWRGDIAVLLFLLALLCADRAAIFNNSERSHEGRFVSTLRPNKVCELASGSRLWKHFLRGLLMTSPNAPTIEEQSIASQLANSGFPTNAINDDWNSDPRQVQNLK